MFTLEQLAERLGVPYVGDKNAQIHSAAGLDTAGANDLTFLGSSKFRHYLKASKAGAIIVTPAEADQVKGNALIADNPYLCFALALSLIFPEPEIIAGTHASAVVETPNRIAKRVQIAAQVYIGPNCEIDEGVYIGPGCIIEEGVKIGKGTRLVASVTIRKFCQIGCNVILHPGVVIGADGFGFANDAGRWVKIAQIGKVIIGDNVDVGANTTIDRGAMGDTVIGEGVILDNLIQIGHNVKIGAHTAVAAQSGIAGSAEVGSYCTIAGQVGIVGHIRVADKVTVTAKSFVTKSITESGSYSSGTPLEPTRNWYRNFARIKNLDNMAKRLKEVEMQLSQESNHSKE